jgi:hypothetical protein
MARKIKIMKTTIIFLLSVITLASYSQVFSIVKNTLYDANNTASTKKSGQAYSIKVEYDTGASKFYSASCYFGMLPNMPDSIRISLIGSLFSKLSDTSICVKPVEALSYRYKGRYNRNPQSTRYNLQIEALVLINYIALSSEAVSYSPFPVLYDKKNQKEITTSGKELDDVIKCYKKWFEKIRREGFKQYSLPMISEKYEWYGSLYQKQRMFDTLYKWEKLYDCPEFIKEED